MGRGDNHVGVEMSAIGHWQACWLVGVHTCPAGFQHRCGHCGQGHAASVPFKSILEKGKSI